MSDIPPSKREILERYRDKIAADDFQVLVADKPPTPCESHQRAEGMDIIGTIGGWVVWTKRKLLGDETGLLTIFVTLIGVFQAFEWLQPKVVAMYEQAANYVSTYISYDSQTPSYYIAFKPPGTPQYSDEAKKVTELVSTGSLFYPISGSHPLVTGSA